MGGPGGKAFAKKGCWVRQERSRAPPLLRLGGARGLLCYDAGAVALSSGFGAGGGSARKSAVGTWKRVPVTAVE